MPRIQDTYISPFTDFGFKKLFGSEPNKDLLLDFLNELLRNDTGEIIDLTYYEQSLKHYRDLKNSIDTAFADGKSEGEAIGLMKGEAIGLSKGEQKGMVNALFQLLESRFGEQPESLYHQLLTFDKTQLECGLQHVFQVDSVAAVIDAMHLIKG